MSREERTGWRDPRLSKFIRELGGNFFNDVDGIGTADDILEDRWIMYYNRKPNVLFEFKRRGARVDLQSAQCDVLRDLADGGRKNPLPAYLVVYDLDKLIFAVYPLNEVGKGFTEGKDRVVLDRPGLKQLLTRIRLDFLERNK